MSQVIMYSSDYCPYCMRARSLLDAKKICYDIINVDVDPAQRTKMCALSGRTSVPQVWIGDLHVGGFSDLWALESQGELDDLLGTEL